MANTNLVREQKKIEYEIKNTKDTLKKQREEAEQREVAQAA
jgi:uncharacterized membrane-anchored protein YhcB (DUF1043 family)